MDVAHDFNDAPSGELVGTTGEYHDGDFEGEGVDGHVEEGEGKEEDNGSKLVQIGAVFHTGVYRIDAEWVHHNPERDGKPRQLRLKQDRLTRNARRAKARSNKPKKPRVAKEKKPRASKAKSKTEEVQAGSETSTEGDQRVLVRPDDAPVVDGVGLGVVDEQLLGGGGAPSSEEEARVVYVGEEPKTHGTGVYKRKAGRPKRK